MSEKRFSFDTEQRSVGEIQVIIDNKEKKVYANYFSICDLLNEQQATIQSLEEEIKLLKPTNIEQYEQIQKLQEENEQLKYINNPIDDEEMTNMECLLLIIPFGILFVLLTGIIIAFLVQLGWVVI